MKILSGNTIVNPNFLLRKNKLSQKNKLERTPLNDVISFSSKNKTAKEKNLSPYVLSSVNLGEELLKRKSDGISAESILSILSEVSPELTICPKSELENVGLYNYCDAFFDPCTILKYDDDGSVFEFDSLGNKIYLNFDRLDGDDMEKLVFILDIVHEYTHFLQEKDSSINDLYLKYSNKDYNLVYGYDKLLQDIFPVFDIQMKAAACRFSIKPEDTKNNMVIPTERKVSKYDILTAMGVKDEKEFKKLVIQNYKKLLNEAMMLHLSSFNPAERKMLSVVKKQDNYSSVLREIIKKKVTAEKEASQAECIIAKKVLGNDKTLNIDIVPIYYEMLEKALSL